MDAIQKVLIKAGRKDLAQEYYKKISRGGSMKTVIHNLHTAESYIESNVPDYLWEDYSADLKKLKGLIGDAKELAYTLNGF